MAGYGLLIGINNTTTTATEHSGGGGSNGGSFLTRADLLALYLSSADVLLDAAIDTNSTSTSSTQSQTTANKGQGQGAATNHKTQSSTSSARSGEQLVAAVRILQVRERLSRHALSFPLFLINLCYFN